MSFSSRLSLVPLLAVLAVPAQAADGDAQFFRGVAGQWTGPGEIVAGKYKGTKFICTFTGSPSEGSLGVVLDGNCRVGVFTQKMRATVERRGNSYRGTFQDGAEGKGLDITSGDVVEGRKMVLSVSRAQLKGAMLTRLADDNTLNVTVSVQVEKDLVPVIGVSLKRVDDVAVGSVSGQ